MSRDKRDIWDAAVWTFVLVSVGATCVAGFVLAFAWSLGY